ncbi:MAG TPA: hypothetical protein VEI74_04940 [Candidatus Methylomirabilis sp.]|nr:hypothetical protein [Candidatus Methylomirabilis sp.]
MAGVLAAIVFGRMIQDTDTAAEDDDALPTSTDTVRYFRHNRRKTDHAARVRNGNAKHMTG